MGQFLQVNGDYNIKTRESGNITLDTGPGVGYVKVTGNLLVEGDTLTVSAENLNVNDNIIVLNFGESGPGVSLDYSGIEIDRGFDNDSSVYPKALFILDDRDPTVPVWTIATGSVVGTLEFNQSNLKLRRIFTDADTDQGHLTLIGDSSANGVVNVSGTINYEQQVRVYGDDAIPNKKYVDDAIQSNPTFQILRDDTRVVAFDKDDVLDNTLYFPPAVGPYTEQPAESLVAIVVDDNINSLFFDDRTVVQDLEFSNTAITTYNDSNINILVRTKGTGKLQTNYALQIDYIGTDPETTAGTPSSVIDATLLYADTPSVGTTGLYFVNTERNGELINKNKALLFSMIF